MMQIVLLYIITAVLFLGADIIGLKFLIRPVFERHVGDLLLDDFRLGPAAIFYLFYIAALLWLVSAAGLRGASLGIVALNAAIFGAVTYGTYEFTNLATLKSWTWAQVSVDLIWGICLTTFAATTGVWLTKTITG